MEGTSRGEEDLGPPPHPGRSWGPRGPRAASVPGPSVSATPRRKWSNGVWATFTQTAEARLCPDCAPLPKFTPHPTLSRAQDETRAHRTSHFQENYQRKYASRGHSPFSCQFDEAGDFSPHYKNSELLPEVREKRHETHFSNIWFIRFSNNPTI